MRIVPAATPRAFAVTAADWIGERLPRIRNPVLALPTGNTPLGLYAELIARSRAGKLRLDSAKVFNLDEYGGLPSSDPHSYAAFLHRHFITPLALPAAQVRLLRGDAQDLDAECRAYDDALAEAGGVDLCILGLGVNGHIAFNEPGTAWDLRTHVVRLSQTTRDIHERQAATAWESPENGLTMGIKTLLEARHILLLIAGPNKQAATQAVHAGKVDAAWPATSMLAHADLTVIELCAPAASR